MTLSSDMHDTTIRVPGYNSNIESIRMSQGTLQVIQSFESFHASSKKESLGTLRSRKNAAEYVMHKRGEALLRLFHVAMMPAAQEIRNYLMVRFINGLLCLTAILRASE